MQHIGQVGLRLLQMDLAAFDAAHIQNVIDEGEQMVAGGQDLAQIVLNPLLVIHIAHRQRGEADDGVHRRADIMGHIGEERTLGPIGSLRGADSLRKSLIDLLVGSPVRHDQNVLRSALHIAAHGDNVEPAVLAGLLVDIFKVPFTLLVDRKPCEIVHRLLCGLLRMQLSQNMNVLLDLFRRDPQQLFRVRADIIRPIRLGVQHQEHIVHVHGELHEQLIPVQDLRVLPSQLDAALSMHERKGQRGNTEDDHAYHHDGAGLQRVHAGVDDHRRNKAHDRPIQNVGALIRHVVPRAVQRYQPGAAAALREIVGQGLYILAGEGRALLHGGQQVVDVLFPLRRAVDDDAAVGMEHISAGSPVKGGDIQHLHNIVIVIGNRHGVIREAPIGPLIFRTGKHQHLRLSGQHGSHDDVAALGDPVLQIILYAQVPRLPRSRHIVAIGGEEVKVGKARLLLNSLDELPDLVLVGNMPHGGFPQVQVGQILLHHLVQHIVGLVEHLRQMGGALLVDGPGHEVEISDAGSGDPQ